MAIDLDAIRRKVQELTSRGRTSSVQLWKPGVGDYRIRGLNWKDAKDGQPFQERWFYYIGNNQGILAPSQFGKPDPIKELTNRLYASGQPEERLLAKKLTPKMRTYMPIIVRGEEDKGVQVWAFGKPIYQRLLGFWLDDEVGDILDPDNGFDLKVSLVNGGKTFNDKPSLDTTIDPARKQSKLHDNPEQVKKWLNSVPSIDDMYQLKSVQEIENILNNWLNSGDDSKEVETDHRRSNARDELDKLADDVKSAKAESSEKDSKAASKKSRKPASEELAESSTTRSKLDLDAAFDELASDEDD